MEQNTKSLGSLVLYNIYSIRYVRLGGNVERLVTPRALFLGEFNKHAWTSPEFLGEEPSEEDSLASRYLTAGFLAYFPRSSSMPSHEGIKGFFEIILCDPEKGLMKQKDNDVITLVPPHFTIKTIACGDTPESKRAFEKVYTIAVKTGLIDINLESRGSAGSSGHLSRTVVRSIHKGFTEIIRMAPDGAE